MVNQYKVKYFNFLKLFQKFLSFINFYTYLYVILWFLQGILFICLFFDLAVSFKLCMLIFISLCSIHLCSSVYEIINDYIFDNFLKRFFSLIILLISCKLVI